jgi:signal transduction histidine kinase
VIIFKKNKNKSQIKHSDNGVGVSFEVINLKNRLYNVENRILIIKGTITFDNESNKGFKTKITFLNN